MQIRRHIIGITTAKLAASRDFYVRNFGFEVEYEGDTYIQLKREAIGLGLLQPDDAGQPPIFQRAFEGNGVWISLEVEDVDAEHERLRKRMPIAMEPTDEPWGERHFAVADPNGVVINVMRMTHVPSAV